MTADWAPIVDIQETDKEYLVKAELPEVKKDDVKVTIKDGLLTLEGERRQEKEEKTKKFHRVERSYGKFVRCLQHARGCGRQEGAGRLQGGRAERAHR